MATMGQEAAVDAGHDAVPAPRTFAGVLRANQGMVFSIAFHFLRDRAAAEEVAQDVFMELYKQLDRLESDAHVSFWLRRVTSHRCIDYTRRRKYQPIVALQDVPEPSISGDPGDVLLNQKVQDLIAALPEKPRIVMVLRYQEDLMPEEIAKVLDMPVRTVKSHLQRSLAMLREKMERGFGGVR